MVAGSSAGAYVLSRYYMSSKGEMGEGLGILPIKTFAHYDKGRKDELNKLDAFGDKLTTYPLGEMKFVIIREKI